MENFVKTLDTLKTKIELQKQINKTENNLNTNFLKLIFESLLSKIPCSLFFSSQISDKLQGHSKLFNSEQLNKLTRFLTHIEKTEIEYNSMYENLEKNYLDEPKKTDIIEIIVLYESLFKFYKIFLMILININENIIVFNKVYNLIEDEGFFMTKTENEKLILLKEISLSLNEIEKNTSNLNKIDSVVKMLNTEKNNINLSSIEDSLLNIEVSLESIKSDVFSLI
jgi:hypothetical protein